MCVPSRSAGSSRLGTPPRTYATWSSLAKTSWLNVRASETHTVRTSLVQARKALEQRRENLARGASLIGSLRERHAQVRAATFAKRCVTLS